MLQRTGKRKQAQSWGFGESINPDQHPSHSFPTSAKTAPSRPLSSSLPPGRQWRPSSSSRKMNSFRVKREPPLLTKWLNCPLSPALCQGSRPGGVVWGGAPGCTALHSDPELTSGEQPIPLQAWTSHPNSWVHRSWGAGTHICFLRHTYIQHQTLFPNESYLSPPTQKT